MKIIKICNYIFENDNYEIRLFRTIRGFKIISYKQGQRANPYSYSISNISDSDYEIYYGEKAYEKLIQLAKDDITNGLVFCKKLPQV